MRKLFIAFMLLFLSTSVHAIELREVASETTPNAGWGKMYANSGDSYPYWIDSTGNVYLMLISGASEPPTPFNLVLDDGDEHSPVIVFIDEDNYQGRLYKSDAGAFVITNDEEGGIGPVHLRPDDNQVEFMVFSTIDNIPRMRPTDNDPLQLGHTLTSHIILETDGTGDGEMVLPDDSIGPNEIDDSADYVFSGGIFDDLHIDHVAPATASSVFSALDIQLNVNALAASSETHGINIAAIGSTSGGITGLGTHTGVAPIHQHVGVFQTPSQTEYAARWPDGGAWTDGIDGNTIFPADDDEIYIGAVAVFGELEVDLSTFASQDTWPVFEFLNDSAAWVAFSPLDGTNGFRQDGIIEWDSSSLTDWDAAGDPGGADGSAGYYARIRRTRPTVVTDPIVTTIKTLDPTEFYWNEFGYLKIAGIEDDFLIYDGAGPSPILTFQDETLKTIALQGQTDGDLTFTLSDGDIDANGETIKGVNDLDASGIVDFGDATSTEVANAADVSGNTALGMLSVDTDNGTVWMGTGSGVRQLTGYVDRGDPASNDYSVGDFTFDATWRDLDVSSIVPAGAVKVYLIIAILDNAVNSRFILRKNGNSNTQVVVEASTTVSGVTEREYLGVACDANRVIEYYGTAGIDTLNATVLGWEK